MSLPPRVRIRKRATVNNTKTPSLSESVSGNSFLPVACSREPARGLRETDHFGRNREQARGYKTNFRTRSEILVVLRATRPVLSRVKADVPRKPGLRPGR
jgi:hypothetical protein